MLHKLNIAFSIYLISIRVMRIFGMARETRRESLELGQLSASREKLIGLSSIRWPHNLLLVIHDWTQALQIR